MSQYQAIKAATNAYIRTNGRQEITGAILNAVMIATIDSLGKFYQSVGVATPDTDPGNIDQNIAYIAGTPGTYAKLGGFELAEGEVAILKFDGAWKKEVVYIIPTRVSQLFNDAGYITNAVADLVNYYTKVETLSRTEMTDILAGYYDKDEVDSIVSAITQQSYVVSWDGTAEPDVADIPDGVVVTYNGNPYTGTLQASASTINKIYLVSNGVGYDEYVTTDNSGYSWVNIGTTNLNLAGYAKSADLHLLSIAFAELDRRTSGIDNDAEQGCLYLVDENGKIIAKFDENGIRTTQIKTTSLDQDLYQGELYITDSNGNVILHIGADGVLATRLSAKDVSKNDWYNKVIATYGDSITAVNNGDFSNPFPITQNNWGNRVAEYFEMSKQYGRGIGSTTFMWRNGHGGQVAWVDSVTGEYVGRNDSYNYDNYVGNVTIPAGCTAIRGDGCSWLRIKNMFPESIKDTIDAVLVQFHNDYHQDMDTEVEFIPGDTTDPEWAASAEYATLGGDYNIGCVQGGIASTIMKLQAWMPDAVIILMTPISGVYDEAGVVDGDFDNSQALLMHKLANVVKDISSRMSISSFDIYSRDGINSLNRTTYIYDKIHPYTEKGSKAIARTIVGLMKSMLTEL